MIINMPNCLLTYLNLFINLALLFLPFNSKMLTFKEILYRTLGDRIKKRREELNYSQEYVAKVVNLSRASISNIETGKHQILLSTLYELTAFLKIDIHLIMPTYNELISKMDFNENSDLMTLLDKKNIDDKLKNDLLNL